MVYTKIVKAVRVKPCGVRIVNSVNLKILTPATYWRFDKIGNVSLHQKECTYLGFLSRESKSANIILCHFFHSLNRKGLKPPLIQF